MNILELLENGYKKCFNELELHKTMKMKNSNLNFNIYKGYGDDNYEYELHFEKSIEFENCNYKKFYFKSDLELGKFIFECKANNGLPKGAKGILK